MADYYVDQTGGSDANTGGSGDPWLTVDYAIGQITPGTNGDTLWVKNNGSLGGTPTYGAWATGKPILIKGYSSTIGDTGRAQITVGSTYMLANSASLDALWLCQLDIVFSSSAVGCILADDQLTIIDCTFSRGSDVTGYYINADQYAMIVDCAFRDLGTGTSITLDNGVVKNCFFLEQDTYTREVQYALYASFSGLHVRDCVFRLDSTGSTVAIRGQDNLWVDGCSIYSDGANTGDGIRVESAHDGVAISNCVIEGFSGTGGNGVSLSSASQIRFFANNSFENNTTDYTALTTPEIVGFDAGNESLGASPFTSASTDDYTPVDTGSVKEGAWPSTFGDLSTV